MDDDLEFDQTQAVFISDLEDEDDLTDDLESSREKEPAAYLKVQPLKDLPGSSYPVYEGDNVIGRQADTCHVCIPSKSLSKEHACIQITADSHLIFDKGSRNKTRRGKLVLQPEVRYELRHGDEISLADVKCVYEIVKQMSEIVPESDAGTDAESDMSESLCLQHDVTDQSDKLTDVTGDRLGDSNRNSSKIEMQQTLVLYESESEDDDDESGDGLAKKRSCVQETVVFESSDDDASSLDLLGMATQAYTKTVSENSIKKPVNSSKMIAATQKYSHEPADEIAGTQSFVVGTSSDEEGTALIGGAGNRNTRLNASKAATRSRQATDKDSEEELSDEASMLFAVSTLAYDANDDVDVDDGDGSCEEGPVEAVSGQNLVPDLKDVTAVSDATAPVPSDATVAVPSDTVAVPSDTVPVPSDTIAVPSDTIEVPSDTIAVCSDATVAVPSLTLKRASKKVISKSDGSGVLSKSDGPVAKGSSLRLAETLVSQDEVSASEEHAANSNGVPTQIFTETVDFFGAGSENASAVSQRRRGKYPSDAGCSDGPRVSVDDVLPVSKKVFAGNRSKGFCSTPQNCLSNEPTQVFGDITEERTQFLGEEPTQAYGGFSDEPTQAYGGFSDEATQGCGGISDEPTQAYNDGDKPTRVAGGALDKPTHILNDSLDKPTQILSDSLDQPTQNPTDSLDKPTQVLSDSLVNQFLNDPFEKPTQMLNDCSDKPTQVLSDFSEDPVNDTYNKPTQTFMDDSNEEVLREKTRPDRNLGGIKDQPGASDGSVPAGRNSSAHASSAGRNNEQRHVSDRTEVEDVSTDNDDVDATQAFVDDDLEEDGKDFESKFESPTQRFFMEAEERLEMAGDLNNYANRRTDAASKCGLDSSDDSDLEELSVLRSSEVLQDDPAQLIESTDKSHTSESTLAEPTLRYDMAVDKDPTLPYDMSVEELPGKDKKRLHPKRKGHKYSKQNFTDWGKELDTSADTNKVSNGINSATELNSPMTTLPVRSPLKSAFVDRRRSPSSAPGNRHVAFAVTVEEGSLEKQPLAGGSADTCQLLSSGKSDQDLPTPNRPGRSRNKRSLQLTTAPGKSNVERDQDELGDQQKSKLTSPIQNSVSEIAQTKKVSLEVLERKSGTGAQKSTETSHRANTRRAKAHLAVEDGKVAGDTSPLAETVSSVVGKTPSLVEDANSVGITPPIAKDVSSVENTPLLAEDSSKESLTPQIRKKRGTIRDEQEDTCSTPGKEVDSTVASASKKGRRSAVVKTEEAVDSGGRRSSARPRKKISYQQLATGSEKKIRSAGPQGEAESGGTASLISDHSSTSTPCKKSATSSDDSTNTPYKKSTSFEGSNNTTSKTSATSLDDSNSKTLKKMAELTNGGKTKTSKNSAASLDERKNATASQNSSASSEDSNSKTKKEVAVLLNDINIKTSENSTTYLDNSSSESCKKSAMSLDDSMTKGSKKSTSLDDSITKASKKSTSLDDSMTKASKKSTSLDDSITKASKITDVSLDDSNTRTSKKSTSLGDSNTTDRKTPATSLDNTNTETSKRSATSVDDSNNMAVGKQQNTRRQRSNKKPKEKTDKEDSKKTLTRQPADPEIVKKEDDESDETASLASFVDDSSSICDETPVALVDDSSGKDSEQLKTGGTFKNTRRSRTAGMDRKGDVKETSNKTGNSDASSDSVSAASRKKDSQQVKSGVISENTRRTTVTRTARKSDAEEASQKINNSDDGTAISRKIDNEQLAVEGASNNTRKGRDATIDRDDDVKETSNKTCNSDASSDSVSAASRKSDSQQVKSGVISENTRRSRVTRMARKGNAKEASQKINSSDDGTAISRKIDNEQLTKIDNERLTKIDNEQSTSNVTVGNTRRNRTTRTPRESDTKEASQKSDISDVDSVTTFSRKIDNETLVITTENTRRSRTARKAGENDTKASSQKSNISDASADFVANTSRKRLHPNDPETGRRSRQLGRSSAGTENDEISSVKQRKKGAVIIDEPGKDHSSTAVDSAPTDEERGGQVTVVKSVRGHSGRTVILDALPSTESNLSKHTSSQEKIGSLKIQHEETVAEKNSRIATRKSLQVEEQGKTQSQKQKNTDSQKQEKRDSQKQGKTDSQKQGKIDSQKQGKIDSQKQGKIDSQKQGEIDSQKQGKVDSQKQKNTDSQKQGEIDSQKKGEIDSQKQGEIDSQKQGEIDSQKQEKTETSLQRNRGRSSKAAEGPSELQTEEIQTPVSRGRRAAKTLVSSEASTESLGSEISQSEVLSSSPMSASARKTAPTTVKDSDIRGRGRKSGRATPMMTDTVSDKTTSGGQNSASEHDKSGQVSAVGETKCGQNSTMKKNENSQNSTKMKRRKTTDKLSQESQINENKEQIEQQISTPPAKKPKQTPTLRTPTGKVQTEKVDSPVLRKSTASSKPRVMFTGYLDKQGEKTVRDLGGELVTSVQECSHLVTDRICRTVKFLSGLAKGLLIASPRWLESCKQAGTFVDGHHFLVSDPAMEKQYKFNLATSINKAQAGPLLVGYKVHVTKSVKPDPTQMQDILKFAGAQFMKSMPSKAQDKLVIISCPEDRPLCETAVKAGIPVVGAEFILTGILRQELDLESFSLFRDETKSQQEIGKKK